MKARFLMKTSVTGGFPNKINRKLPTRIDVGNLFTPNSQKNTNDFDVLSSQKLEFFFWGGLND